MTDSDWNFSGLRALFINCTLKRSPDVSNTQALVDASRALMEGHGVATESLRLIDHDVATGVWPDMTEHGWATDEWPQIQDTGVRGRHPRARRARSGWVTTARS